MLYLFNTTIMPNEGVFSCKMIQHHEALMLLRDVNFHITSALGHQGSVDAFNALFPGLNCEMNRIQATMNKGDKAICLKVRGRLPEGSILTLDQLNEVGYDLFEVWMVSNSINDMEMDACYAGAAPITGAIWR